MKSENLVLWATNHAPMYQTHLKLIREHVSYASWILHVTGTLIPGYRRDLHEPHEGMSTYETLMAASKLMEYYAEHIAEGEPDNIASFTKGERIQAHPATDTWMRGDRYGVVVLVGRKRVHVLMDRSNRVIKFWPNNLLHVERTPGETK